MCKIADGERGQKKGGGAFARAASLSRSAAFDQFGTIVTARRFWAQLASSEPRAIGRSLP
jgi:hypothetical protein